MNGQMQAVILGGGKGTRLGPSAGGPKPLVEIGGRPFIMHLIDNLRRFGIRDIVILAGPFASDYAARLGDGTTAGLRITLVPEPGPAGTAGALTYAAPHLASEFLLLNGDSYLDINPLDLAIRARASDAIAAVALLQIEDTGRYGTVIVTGETVHTFAEKSASGPGLINAGAYWFKRDILVEIGAPPASLEHDVMPRLAARGTVRGFTYHARFIDIGTPDDLARARNLIPKWQRRPTAFLDRDGVLNRDAGYVWRTQDFEWLPGARKAIKDLNDAGFLVMVITNQAGIARGLYSEDDVRRLHQWINSDLERSGAHIDAFYYCPHHPVDGIGIYRSACDCRKPAPGLLLRAMKDWPIDGGNSFMVGDKDADLQAARAAGIQGIRSSAPLDILVRGLIMDQR